MALPKAKRLVWRERKNGERVAIWRRGLRGQKANYPVRSQLLWRGEAPTIRDVEDILTACKKLNRELADWLKNPDQKRPRPSAVRPGFVYFVRGAGLVKIGFAEDTEKRLRALQVGSSERLELLGKIPATPEREKVIHGMFGHLREHGEWFRPEPELLAYIEQRWNAHWNALERLPVSHCP